MPIEAVCVMQGEQGHGKVFFRQEDENDPCHIIGKLKNLSPGYHGLHIHQYGNQSGGCSTTGICFNPRRVDHGAPWDCPLQRHIGDLGNIKADSCGVARIDMTDNLISLVGPESVVGRSLVVHADPDDFGRGHNYASKQNGNVGARMACGIIGISRRT